MNKSTFFSGQPIFTQLLALIPKEAVIRIAKNHRADRYAKRFNTYEHLVTMLYSIFNACTSLREVTTGMLATEQRLQHLGIRFHPRRSTLSDANMRRSSEVFGQIYYYLLERYSPFLSDSRKKATASRLFIFDTTTISLCSETSEPIRTFPGDVSEGYECWVCVTRRVSVLTTLPVVRYSNYLLIFSWR